MPDNHLNPEWYRCQPNNSLMLVWHAHGEELAIFRAVEAVALERLAGRRTAALTSAWPMSDQSFMKSLFHGVIAEVLAFASRLPATNVAALSLGAGSLALVLVLRQVAPRVPGPLLVAVASTVLVAAVGAARLGVVTVGTLPRGLPTLSWPSVGVQDTLALFAAAVGEFYQDGGKSYSFTNVRGETVQVYGQGLYRYDTTLSGVGAKVADAAVLLPMIPALVLAIVLYRGGSLRGGLLCKRHHLVAGGQQGLHEDEDGLLGSRHQHVVRADGLVQPGDRHHAAHPHHAEPAERRGGAGGRIPSERSGRALPAAIEPRDALAILPHSEGVLI